MYWVFHYIHCFFGTVKVGQNNTQGCRHPRLVYILHIQRINVPHAEDQWADEVPSLLHRRARLLLHSKLRHEGELDQHNGGVFQLRNGLGEDVQCSSFTSESHHSWHANAVFQRGSSHDCIWSTMKYHQDYHQVPISMRKWWWRWILMDSRGP